MDIYILPSGSEHADAEKTAASFEGIPFFYKCVNSLEDIIYEERGDDWYMIMYDNEHIDDKLVKAIPVYLLSQFEVLECYKRTSATEGTLSPRLFRGHINPQWNSLLPIDIKNLKTTRILDGWIEPHVKT